MFLPWSFCIKKKIDAFHRSVLSRVLINSFQNPFFLATLISTATIMIDCLTCASFRKIIMIIIFVVVVGCGELEKMQSLTDDFSIIERKIGKCITHHHFFFTPFFYSGQ